MAFWDFIFGKKEVLVFTEQAAYFDVTLQLKDLIRYQVIVSPMENGCFQLERGKITVNGEPASAYVALDLAAKCGELIYPLQVDALFTALFNHETIKQRWAEKEVSLKKYFTGPEALAYIEATGRTVLDAAALMQALQQDHFLAWWARHAKKTQTQGSPVEVRLPILNETIS